MNDTEPAFHAVVDWLLEREAGEARDVGELAVGAERACRKLEAVLRDIIGGEGYSAVLLRAQRLAQAERPYLAGVAHGDGGECLAGLAGALAGQEPKEARRGLVSLLDHALQVLSSLITPEIVLSQVERAWRDLPRPLVQAAMKEQEK